MSAGARVFEYINLEPTIPIEGGKVCARIENMVKSLPIIQMTSQRVEKR